MAARTPFQRPARRSWWQKFSLAFRGVAVGVRGQDSFVVHIPVALLVIGLAVWLGLSRVEWCLLLICITMVLTAELFNSALEFLARGLERHHNTDVGNALDIASGAVLIASIGAAAVGAVVLGSRLYAVIML